MKSLASASVFNIAILCILIGPSTLASLGRAEQGREATAAAHLERGISFVKKGEIGMAIADFEIALQFDPNSAGAYSIRGELYSRKGDYQKALEDRSRAIEIKPTLPEAYTNRGAARFRMRDLEGSIRDHSRGFRADSSFV